MTSITNVVKSLRLLLENEDAVRTSRFLLHNKHNQSTESFFITLFKLIEKRKSYVILDFAQAKLQTVSLKCDIKIKSFTTNWNGDHYLSESTEVTG